MSKAMKLLKSAKAENPVTEEATTEVKKDVALTETTTEEAKTGEIVDDALLNRSLSVDNLKADQLVTRFNELNENENLNFFEIAGLLWRINNDGIWQNAELGYNYNSFKDFVDAGELDVSYRNALRQAEMYKGMVNLGITYDQVKKVGGWTKCYTLVSSKILTPDTVLEWIDLAAGMSKADLEAALKQKQAQLAGNVEPMDGEGGEGSGGDGGATQNETTTLKFALHADQLETVNEAIDQAKIKSDTTVNSVALEYICVDYLSGNLGTKDQPTPQQDKTLEEILKEHDITDAVAAFEKAFPNVKLKVEL